MDISKLKKAIKGNLNQLIDIFRFILPSGREEIYLFLFFGAMYSAYSFPLTQLTYILDFPFISNIDGTITCLVDPYFGFDSVYLFHQGWENIIGHPLIKLYSAPFIFFGSVLSDLFNPKAKTFLFVLLCIIMISLSIVYVYRYLRKVVKLCKFESYLLASFYGFFATNLLLAFTTETFTISAFLLSFSVCFYSIYISKEAKVYLASNFFFAFALGGITITNFAKGIIPMFFVRDKYIKTILKIGLICFLFSLVILYNGFSDGAFIFLENVDKRMSYFGSAEFGWYQGSLFEKVIDSFFAGPIIFSDIKYGESTFLTHTIVRIGVDNFRHWWLYAFSIPLLIMLIISVVRNLKNKYVWIILALYGVDLFIHLGFKYGVAEGFFIYGGHWIYVVPLLLGWLYKSYGEKTRNVLNIGICILFAIMFLNNLYRLKDFITVAFKYYPLFE